MEENSAGHEGLRSQVRQLQGKGTDFAAMKEQPKTSDIGKVKAALEVLGRKGSSEDVAAYRQWIQSSAQRVAEAAKEGSFLGFGGERVSEGEKQMLASLAGVPGTQGGGSHRGVLRQGDAANSSGRYGTTIRPAPTSPCTRGMPPLTVRAAPPDPE